METKPHLPPGASLIPDRITPAEETALAAFLDAGEWSGALRRRVRHFGYRYDYRARIPTPESRIGPLREELLGLGRRMVEAGIFASLPDQVIANEYLPGQGISAHVDCEPCFGDVIVSLSLSSPCEMQFRCVETGEARAAILPTRSLLVLDGAARHDWTHAIPATVGHYRWDAGDARATGVADISDDAVLRLAFWGRLPAEPIPSPTKSEG